MSMFTLSLTRPFDFDNIVMWEPVKNLRIKLWIANVWCKQTHVWSRVSYTAEWMNFIYKSWYFSALCFHVFYSTRSNFRKWFQLNLTKHGATFSSLNISRRTQCSGYDEHTCHKIFFSLCWKLKRQKRLSCDRVIKRDLGNLSSQARW